MGKEELLDGGVAVLLLVEVDVLALGVCEVCNVGEAQAAVVGCIFAKGELAVDLTSSTAVKLPYSLHFTIGLGVELLAVFGCPPVDEVAVDHRTGGLIVEAVRELVADDAADVAIDFGVGGVGVIEGRLQDAGREVDVVHTGVVE